MPGKRNTWRFDKCGAKPSIKRNLNAQHKAIKFQGDVRAASSGIYDNPFQNEMKVG